MIEVDPQVRSALRGGTVLVLGAGWVAYAFLASGNRVFLAIMIILSIALGAVATYFVQSRSSP